LSNYKKGLLQFTDTTNAYRLFKEYGKDIRYNALWKKWVCGTVRGGRWTMAI
jgi:putative DNA primase/helicase